MADACSEFGSVVAIYTHLGEIYLDGTQISFHESLEGTFSRAGFEVDSGTRRLLGVAQVLGLFNVLSNSFDDSAIGNLTALLAGIPTYTGQVSVIKVCESIADGCFFTNGDLVDHVSTYMDTQAIVTSEQQFLYEIESKPYSLTIATKAQYEAQKLYTVRNESHKLVFQEYGNGYYHCALTPDDGLGSGVSDDNSETTETGNSADSVIVTALGQIEVDDKYGNPVNCNHWRIEIQGSEVIYYETVDNPRFFLFKSGTDVVRFDDIQFATTGLKFDSMAAAECRGVPVELLDLEATLAKCDPQNIIKPQKMRKNEISNVVAESPSWGTLASRRRNSPSRRAAVTGTMSAAEWEEILGQHYTNLTVAQCAAQDPPCDFDWCIKEVVSGNATAKIAFMQSGYERCNTSPRRSHSSTTDADSVTTLYITIGGNGVEKICDFKGTGWQEDWVINSADCDCFSGDGHLTVISDCNTASGLCTLTATGTMAATLQTFQCFQAWSLTGKVEEKLGGTVPESAVFTAPLAVGGAVHKQVTEVPVTTTTAFGNAEAFWYDNWNGLTEETIPKYTLSQTIKNDAGDTLMGVELEVSFDVTIVPIQQCSDNQKPGGFSQNQQLGVRINMDMRGTISYYVNNDGVILTNPILVDFDAFRPLFPLTDAQTDTSSDNYHLQLQPNSDYGAKFDTALGLLELNGLPCFLA